MRRFQFRLERFLELRRWKEREWELKLARAQGECLLLENRIREIGEEIGASRLAQFSDGRRVDVELMARRELFVQRLAVERERAQVTLVEKRREMEKVRTGYLEASRDRKVLDKLK
ncbi:MAG TPA: flagellar FliJ family protein, partial [Spirochaetia bacterium]|nr:flagellar FliJ family protein [Spirochaetia bacterium]